MALQGKYQAIGEVPNDSDGLRLGNHCDLVHCAGDEGAEIAEFRFSFSANPPV